ncbi:class I SAM-dependent methyltransferase [Streptomyces sp. DSM 15324]|uniref:class I SAM-dependent methyltransferase n=1 Tax=Streptomyces sp. DSM 15324 TaxID=1739111 RepID=UPI000748CCE8|nr:class I SAM-dependent methyltransferase [Streptomyces sp. DSM 15324]KUO09980.1 methyltransferase type 12 [Streptomyces sp. DSM 15324]
MTTASTAAVTYWEPLWSQGRRYRQLDGNENRLLEDHLGPGCDRPALDIGCGDGSLARGLAELGYRATGIDCSPSAIELAAAYDARPGHEPAWRCMDITTDDLRALPEPAYAVVTCRLVYRWIDNKAAFLDRVRRLLAPGGTFWVVTEIAGRRPATDPLQCLGITPAQAEILTANWSAVRTADLDVLRCYALRP